MISQTFASTLRDYPSFVSGENSLEVRTDRSIYSSINVIGLGFLLW